MSEKFVGPSPSPGRPSPAPRSSYRVVGDSEDGDDVVLAEQAPGWADG